MLMMNLQLFAHKKGVGSSKNGRDSESKRLGAKAADGELVVVDAFSFEKPCTKEAAAILKSLDLNGRITLVVADDDINTYLSFRNIPAVRVLAASEANTYDFIDNKALVFTSAALSRIEEVLA